MQRAVPFAFQGVNPPNPQKALLSTATLSSLRSRGELTHNPPTAVSLAMLKGHWWVAHRMASHSGWLVDNRAPREREGAFGKYSP